MARYIDADKMIDGYCTTFPYNLEYCDDGDLMEWLNAQPTADVAPRAEVERLQEDVERLQEINNRHIENIRLAKQEVAREIFEEIEEYASRWCGDYYISIEKLEELKKKYTEGQK